MKKEEIKQKLRGINNNKGRKKKVRKIEGRKNDKGNLTK